MALSLLPSLSRWQERDHKVATCSPSYVQRMQSPGSSFIKVQAVPFHRTIIRSSMDGVYRWIIPVSDSDVGHAAATVLLARVGLGAHDSFLDFLDESSQRVEKKGSNDSIDSDREGQFQCIGDSVVESDGSVNSRRIRNR